MPKPKNKTHGIMNFVYTYLIHQNILYLYRISLIKNIIQKVFKLLCQHFTAMSNKIWKFV